MKKLITLILALTLILSYGNFGTQAAGTTLVNYAASGATVVEMNGTSNDAIFEDTDNSIITNVSGDTNHYSNYALTVGGRAHSKMTTNNTWFMITLSEERYVSEMVVDQWKNNIKNYRIFATSNDDIAAEVSATNGKGLSEYGKVHIIKSDNVETSRIEYNDANTVYTIDKLNIEGALVASGNLNGTNVVTTEKTTIEFNSEKKAKYIIFVIDTTSASSSGTVIDYVEVRGDQASNLKPGESMEILPENYATESISVLEMDGANDETLLFTDKDSSEITLNGTDDPTDYRNNTLNVGNIANSSRTTNNTWFMIALPEEQRVSAIVIDQWRQNIKNYRVFATSNDDIAAEVSATSGKGLSEYGKVHIVKSNNAETSRDEYNDPNTVYTIDKLIAEGSLVASGNLNGDNTGVEKDETIVFNKEKKAKYIIFVIDTTAKSGSGTYIDYVEVLGNDSGVIALNWVKAENNVTFTAQIFNASNKDDQNFVVFALHMNGDSLADITKVSVRTLASMKGIRFKETVTPVAGATSVRFMVLNYGTLVPLDVVRSITLQ